MRPMITDFSAGELSKKVAGRIDLPIYYKGAQKMLNFFSPQTGGAERRGGFVYNLDAPTNTGKTRLIPWSIGENVDLLLAISNKSIRFIDVSGGKSPVYLASADNSALNITTLDSNSLIDSYLEADIYKINYAQDRNEMVMSCKGYPLFFMRYLGKTDTTITLEYGLSHFSGVIASNPTASLDDESTVISSDELASALRYLTNNTSYSVDSGSYIYVSGVKKYVKSVRLNTIANTSKLTVQLYNRSGPFTLDYSDSTYTTYPIYYNDVHYSNKTLVGGLLSERFYAGPNVKKINSGASYKAVIDELAKNIGQYDRHRISTADPDSSGTFSRVLCGYVRLNWNPSSYTMYVEYYDSGTSGTATAKPFSNSAEEPISCSINISAEGVSVSGTKASGQVIFDYVAAWMIKGKRYLCDQSKTFNGAYAIAATKQSDGTEDVLTVEMGGITDSKYMTIKRSTTGLSGRLAIITTPFYDSTEKPEVICFHQGRLCVASGNVLYMSKPNDHSNFEFFEEVEYKTTSLKDAEDWTNKTVPETRTDTSRTQQIGAANAIVLQIATEDDESIRWLVSAGDLIIGTTTTEWVLPAACDATNSRVVQTSRTGSAAIQARFIGDSVLFVSRTGKSVRMFNPNTRAMSPDISMFADHLLGSGIVSFDFRLDPEQEVLFLMADGTISRLRLTSSPDGSLASWSQYDSIGVSGSDDIESIATLSIPGEDAIFAVIKRTIGGTIRRYIERMITCDHEVFASRSHLDSSVYVASTSTGYLASIARFGIVDPVKVSFRSSSGIEFYGHLTFTGSNVTTFFNESTGAMQDIPANCEAWIGYSMPSKLETFRIDSQETEGISKATQKIHFRLYESGPFKVYDKHDESCDFEWPIGEMNDIRTIPYTGPITVEYDSGEDTDQSIKVLSDDNQSVNILVIAPNVSIGGNI